MGSVCAPGTYRNTEGALSASECPVTTGGMYAQNVVATTIDEYITPSITYEPCEPGFYCPDGSYQERNVDLACQPGTYCPGQDSTPINCDPRTYNFNYEARECVACPAGYYCDDPQTMAAVTMHDPTSSMTYDDWQNFIIDFKTNYKCAAGHYCPEGTETATENPCPMGSYNPNEGAKSADECILAPPGYYVPTSGASTVDTSHRCAAGHYCMLGSHVADPNSATDMTGSYFDGNAYSVIGDECAIGTYCPLGSSKEI
jgi:hypothetical protein